MTGKPNNTYQYLRMLDILQGRSFNCNPDVMHANHHKLYLRLQLDLVDRNIVDCNLHNTLSRKKPVESCWRASGPHHRHRSWYRKAFALYITLAAASKEKTVTKNP